MSVLRNEMSNEAADTKDEAGDQCAREAVHLGNGHQIITAGGELSGQGSVSASLSNPFAGLPLAAPSVK